MPLKQQKQQETPKPEKSPPPWSYVTRPGCLEISIVRESDICLSENRTVQPILPNLHLCLYFLFFSLFYFFTMVGKHFACHFFMGRRLRYMEKPNTTFEVTSRAIQGRLLLRPSKELNQIILGILGRFLARYPDILLHLVIVASNHIHFLLTTPSVELLANFMRDINSNIAREAGRLYHWKEKFWGRRYAMIPVEEGALLERAHYILSHGCKEGLVLRPDAWPGLNCVEAVTKGKKLCGIWYDRTKKYEAARVGIELSPHEYAIKYEVSLSPLPCFKDLSEAERRAHYRSMVADIERRTKKQFGREGRRVLGVKGVLKQNPQRRPKKIKQSKAPLFHCSDPDKWRAYRDNYRWFVGLYQEASRRLRSGDRNVIFPANCFPPRLAFTGPDPPG